MSPLLNLCLPPCSGDRGLDVKMAGDLQGFPSADYTWVKVNKCLWWPAQVVDETTVSKKRIPKRKAPDGSLVRLYGTYHYLFADILAYSSEFDSFLRQNNRSARLEFQKVIEKLTHGIRKCGNPEKDVNEMEETIGQVDDAKTAASKRSEKKARVAIDEKIDSSVQNDTKKRKATGNDVADSPKIKRQKVSKVQNSENHGKPKWVKAVEQHGTKKLKVPKGLKTDAPKKKGQGGVMVQKPKQKSSSILKLKTQSKNTSRSKKIPESTTKSSKAKKQKEQSGGEVQKKKMEPSTDDLSVTNLPRKPKKSVIEADGNVSEGNEAISPQTERRIKVMQGLGLIAPSGSPFTNGFSSKRLKG